MTCFRPRPERLQLVCNQPDVEPSCRASSMFQGTVFSTVFWVNRSNGAACIDAIYSALLPPSFDHRLCDAKSLLATVLLSSFNNRGHGRVAL